MAKNPIIRITEAIAHLDDIDTQLGSSAVLKIYSGTAPTSLTTPASGLLVSMTAGANMFNAASGSAGDSEATMTLAATLSGTASAGAPTVASYFRLETSGGTELFQGTVAMADADLIMLNTSITSGETVEVDTLTLRKLTGDD